MDREGLDESFRTGAKPPGRVALDFIHDLIIALGYSCHIGSVGIYDGEDVVIVSSPFNEYGHFCGQVEHLLLKYDHVKVIGLMRDRPNPTNLQCERQWMHGLYMGMICPFDVDNPSTLQDLIVLFCTPTMRETLDGGEHVSKMAIDAVIKRKQLQLFCDETPDYSLISYMDPPLKNVKLEEVSGIIRRNLDPHPDWMKHRFQLEIPFASFMTIPKIAVNLTRSTIAGKFCFSVANCIWCGSRHTHLAPDSIITCRAYVGYRSCPTINGRDYIVVWPPWIFEYLITSVSDEQLKKREEEEKLKHMLARSRPATVKNCVTIHYERILKSRQTGRQPVPGRCLIADLPTSSSGEGRVTCDPQP